VKDPDEVPGPYIANRVEVLDFKRGTPKSLGSGHPPSDARRLSLGTPEKRGLCQMIKQLLSQLAGCKGLSFFQLALGFSLS
jgi:hypothetical protein